MGRKNYVLHVIGLPLNHRGFKDFCRSMNLVFFLKNFLRLVWTAVLAILTISVLSPMTGLGQPVLETVLYGFGAPPDGSSPQSGVTLGVDRALYGTTTSGGIANDYGVAFKVNFDGSGYTVVRNFTNTPDSGTPGPLMFGNDGVLYGMATGGGASGLGTVFKMQSDGNGYQILHDFNGAPDGSNPFGGLTQATNGALYGVTHLGGTNNQGCIFTIQTNGTGYQILYSFTNNPDGATPQETLIQGSDGALYGTTYNGGTSNRGVIFKIQLNGSGYQILHTFTNNPDGANPRGSLMQASDGALYGTTQIGGSANDGIVYKMNPDGGDYTILHNFTSVPDGRSPLGGVIQGLNNLLYGTTGFGGINGLGSVYRIQLGGGGYQVLYSFTNNNDTARPAGNLTRGASIGDIGVMYGAGQIGGFGHGAVFAVVANPSLNITPVVDRTPTNGPIVFWPTFAYNSVLQTTTNIVSGPWVNVTNGVPFTGLQITNLSNSGGSYFRLVWPQ
jgi:uncharacterized repeat protein (TIGR03803 family)